jgi:TolB protein
MERRWSLTITRLAASCWAISAVLFALLPPLSHILTSGGGQIVFQSDRTGNWDLYLMDLNSSLVYNLTRSPNNEMGPVWSQSRKQIAFYADHGSDHRPELAIMNLNGGNQRLLRDEGGGDWRPSWSPDARQLVFMVGYASIRIMDVDGGNMHELTYGFSPRWSPSGSQIAFYADHPPRSLNADIFVISTDGRDLVNLTDNHYHNWDPAWSPDGRQLAFISSRNGSASVYVMNADCGGDAQRCGTDIQQLTYSTGMDAAPAWSPDGRQIAFESQRDGYAHLYVMNADGANLHRVTFGASNNRFATWIP